MFSHLCETCNRLQDVSFASAPSSLRALTQIGCNDQRIMHGILQRQKLGTGTSDRMWACTVHVYLLYKQSTERSVLTRPSRPALLFTMNFLHTIMKGSSTVMANEAMGVYDSSFTEVAVCYHQDLTSSFSFSIPDCASMNPLQILPTRHQYYCVLQWYMDEGACRENEFCPSTVVQEAVVY